MTVCNMSIEAGARAGMIAPDETTFEYLAGRPLAPKGAAWDAARRALARAADRRGRGLRPRGARSTPRSIEPMITCGTNPGMGDPDRAASVPDPGRRRGASRSALALHGPRAGRAAARPAASTWSSSARCTNSRLSDLRAGGAACCAGRHVARGRARARRARARSRSSSRPRPRGSTACSATPGAEWREPGCSMCIAMNGDRLEPGQYAVSTSNRNFEGRQGTGGRTFLASPSTAAAAAVTRRDRRRARAAEREMALHAVLTGAHRRPAASTTSTPTRSSRRAS